MRTALLSSLALASYLACSPALAGDWASGGGEVILDTQNPWFLQNTQTVDVCLIWDKDHFHPVDQTMDGLKTRFDQSIAYWKRELARSWVVGRVLSVGTQDFRVTEVNELTGGRQPTASFLAKDLRIQFGWLSQEQIDFFDTRMGGVQKYLAATVRTSYEPIQMRGQGFIYLKPDTGPLSAQAVGIVQNPWGLGQGYLTNHALLHELGHMFGVPHKALESVMGVDHLERNFSEGIAQEMANHLPNEQGFFAWNREETIRETCVSPKRKGWREFLTIPAEHECLTVKFLGENQIAFYTGETAQTDGADALRGVFTFDPQKVTYSFEEVVRIYLPEGQLAVDRVADGGGMPPWILGPLTKIEEFSGVYKSADGTKTRQMFVTLNPQGLGFAATRFSVEIDGQWYFNLDWIY